MRNVLRLVSRRFGAEVLQRDIHDEVHGALKKFGEGQGEGFKVKTVFPKTIRVV